MSNKSQSEAGRGDEKAQGGEPVHEQELVADRPPEPMQDPAAESTAKPRRPRGFAAMDRTLVSEIARKGGKAAHSAGTAHEFTTEEARVAGRKGGRATHAKRRTSPEPEATTAATSESAARGESGGSGQPQ